MTSKNTGFAAVWVLGILAAGAGILTVLVGLLGTCEAYAIQRKGRLMSRAQAHLAMEEACLELEATTVTGTWRQAGSEGTAACEGVYDHRGDEAWALGGLGILEGPQHTPDLSQTLDLGEGFRGQALEETGYSYGIQTAQDPQLGLLWDAHRGTLKEALSQILDDPEVQELVHAKRWKYLLKENAFLPQLPLLKTAALRITCTHAGQRLRGRLMLELYNPFNHTLQGPLKLNSKIGIRGHLWDEEDEMEDIVAVLDFSDTDTLRMSIPSGRTQRMTIETEAFNQKRFERTPLRYAFELHPLETDGDVIHFEAHPSWPSEAQECVRPRSYALQCLGAHLKNEHPIGTPSPFAYWDLMQPELKPQEQKDPLLVRLNLQPHKSFLKAQSPEATSTWPPSGAPLLDPICSKLKHIGQLCRATPGYNPTDPTWPFGAPSRKKANSEPIDHSQSQTRIQVEEPPDPVHLLSAYSLWDHAFIAPDPNEPSSYYSNSQGQLWIQKPLNVNSATHKQWQEALDIPPLRAFLSRHAPRIILHKALTNLAQALSTPQPTMFTSILSYIESGTFQKALETAQLGHLWQSAFLEHLGPRLCVRSDTFEVCALGQAPSTGNRRVRNRLKRRLQRFPNGRVVVVSSGQFK